MTSSGDQTNRTLSGTSWTLTYDYDSQLTSTSTGGSTVSSFAYDALGRRYSRSNGGTTTRFFYGPGGILAEKQGSTFTAAYAYGNALIRRSTEYPMFDGLGSQRTATNSSQTVTATAIYEGFGQTIATTGSTSNPLGFAGTSGYRTDGDAGLMHVGARYYDAQVGRFTVRDTYLAEHPYSYCEHDPANRLDPSGHLWWLVGVFVITLLLDSEQPADPPSHPYHRDIPVLTGHVILGALIGAGLKALVRPTPVRAPLPSGPDTIGPPIDEPIAPGGLSDFPEPPKWFEE